jgi:hypothetical protein
MKADVKKQIESIMNKAKLNIVIFGPSQSNSEIYKKRCQIKDLLNELGHKATFPEEIWTPNDLLKSGLNISAAELIQIADADYIICIEDSYGSHGEMHDFARMSHIAIKMLVCIDQEHRNGYTAKGIVRIFEGLHGKVDWYQKPADLTDCHLATRILDQVQKVAEAKQWAIIERGL